MIHDLQAHIFYFDLRLQYISFALPLTMVCFSLLKAVVLSLNERNICEPLKLRLCFYLLSGAWFDPQNVLAGLLKTSPNTALCRTETERRQKHFAICCTSTNVFYVLFF